MLGVQLGAARVAPSNAFEKLLGSLHVRISENEKRNAGFLLAAVLVAVLPIDLSHLVSLLCGVLGYLLLQELQPSRGQVPAGKTPKLQQGAPWRAAQGGCRTGVVANGRGLQCRTPLRTARTCKPHSTCSQAAAPPTPGARKPEVRAPSAVPVVAPTFRSVGWEAEVAELLGQIAPTPESEAAVAQIAVAVKAVVCPVLPEAEVVAFAAGSLANGSAFSVAVPEVDVVIHANPAVLQGRLQARWARSPAAAKLDARKLQKSAIRSCTDCLVGSGTFKFRRSAFQGDGPKVILVAPGERQNVPMNLFVNSAMPLHNAALITECGRLDPRARELILLVRRWAKDRSLCHAAKGHLSPYAWTLLAVFFLQAGAEGGSVLPPLEVFKASAGLLARQSASSLQPRSSLSTAADTNPASAAELFKGFLSFYAVDFDWRKEAISVRLGRRAQPETSLPLHIVLQEDGSCSEVGPSIEDPFEASQNLGACTSAASLAHLHEELQRAHSLCAQGASLTRLLEPWAPPEVAAAEQGK